MEFIAQNVALVCTLVGIVGVVFAIILADIAERRRLLLEYTEGSGEAAP